MTDIPAMVFAAGRGTRMAPLTDTCPKPLIEVAGKPLIDHALSVLRDASVRRIVVNTHAMADKVQLHLAGRDVITIHEPQLLETGGGLRNAMSLLNASPVITLNSDAVWADSSPVRALLDQWDPKEMDALLLLVPVERAAGHTKRGDFHVGGDGRLVRDGGFVYTGLQMLKPEQLFEIDETAFSLNVIWDRMAQEQRLFGAVFEGKWCDVGQPASIAIAEDMLGV